MSQGQVSTDLRLLAASDLHGSNSCFVKLVRLATEIDAHAICIAGDFSGKEAYLLSRDGESTLVRTRAGTRWTLANHELESHRREWGDRGIYSVNAAADDTQSYWRLLREAKRRRLRQWLEYARTSLSSRQVSTYVIPGNDDGEEISDELQQNDWIRYVDERVLPLGELEVAGVGYSTPTPWDTPREIPDEEIADRLQRLVVTLRDPARGVFLIHVPPIGLGLDIAPQLEKLPDGSLREIPGGHAEVGSEAVREFVEQIQPLLVISGHCHDAQGFRRLGRSLCVNPGSMYQNGILMAALLIIRGGRVVGHQALVR